MPSTTTKTTTHTLEIVYKPQFNHSYFTVGLDYPNGQIIGEYQTNTNNTITNTFTLTNQQVLVSGNSYEFTQGVDTLTIKLDGVIIVDTIAVSYSDVIQVN